ncbi:CynX/NimT family MFS transporter [Streptomyces sp. DH37]|uniref:MFS transporter n=1 Tax=Streptomyces sp. DH37 TaxID=3040122 RepID=UPI0024418B94|nr:MFS transporter [Streptomyces sp. DH37]MDG9701993.1 MFS transporter [Streptomyces sp. DH37]
MCAWKRSRDLQGESPAYDGLTAARLPSSPRGYWGRFVLLYLCGVLAATGLGKLAPVSVDVRAALGLSLDQMSLLISSITAVAALFGVPVSRLIGRMVLRWALLGGCAVMAAAGLLQSRADGFGPMLGMRLVESVGYVAVVVAAPAVIIAMDAGPRRVVALAAWGTYFPVGLAVGSFAGGLLSSWLGWRVWLAAESGALLAIGAAAALALGRPGPGDGTPAQGDGEGPASRGAGARRLLGPLLLAAGFATASGTIVAVVSLFPAYLHEELGVPTATAGTMTGLVSLAGIAGGFLSGWLLRRGVPVRHLFTASLLMPLGAALAFLQSGGVALSAFGALLVALANELVVAAAFATIPAVVSASRDVSLANGLLAQIGSAGSLVGPPLVGSAVLLAGGWWAVGPTVLAVCAVGTVLLRASVRRAG